MAVAGLKHEKIILAAVTSVLCDKSGHVRNDPKPIKKERIKIIKLKYKHIYIHTYVYLQIHINIRDAPNFRPQKIFSRKMALKCIFVFSKQHGQNERKEVTMTQAKNLRRRKLVEYSILNFSF